MQLPSTKEARRYWFSGKATEMAITRTLGAIPYHGWAIPVPLVLVGNVVVASLAWWLVGLVLK
jgi:hypothetical protein